MEIIEQRRVALLPLILRDVICFVILIGFYWLLKDLITYATTKMTLRKDSLEGKTGLIHTQRTNSPLDKINGVTVESGFWGKIFNYGTIVVSTAGNTFYFPGIAKANAFTTAINQQIEAYKEEAMKKNARMMAEAMRG